MFLCEIVDSIGHTLDGLGIFGLPVIGDILLSLIESLWDLLGCD